ncbi:MAG: sulfatase-like hydrolase/transferase [Cyclobacteriaceae bacterium]
MQHPNILFILVDDMGYGDPQSYNPQSKIPTPNIDRIAQNGVRFTDAHSPSPWYVREGLVIGEQVVWQGSWKFIRGEEGSLSRV